jgi:hypothetical protein
MRLSEVVRTKPVKWVPEKPPNPRYLADLRYANAQSIYKISGNVVEQLREFLPKQLHNETHPNAWTRILGDAPWDPPESPHRYVPLLFVHHFDVFDYVPPTQDWLVAFGMKIEKALSTKVYSSPFTRAYRAFIQAASLAKYPGQQGGDLSQYVAEAEMVAEAVADLKSLWYDFLDLAVTTAQAQLKLDTPPIFVFLLTDFRLNPQAQAGLERSLTKCSHPRLFCLLAEETV